MSAQGNGLTLEGLAHKLETLQRENATNAQRLQTLERENERMRSENTELRSKVATLEGSGARRERLAEMSGLESRLDAEPVAVLEGRVSRRSLLSKAGAAAVAAVAAGTLLSPREAKAHDTDSPIYPRFVYADWLAAEPHDDRAAVRGDVNSTTWGALTGFNLGSGPGVRGTSDTGRGVEGTSAGGTGVSGIASGSGGIGVFGKSKAFNPGPGVRGDGSIGVWGTAITSGQAGVYGNHDLFGPGVVGDGSGDYAGVWGRNSVSTGVRGQGKTGVLGVGSDVNQAGVKGEGPTGVWGITSRTSYAGVYGEHQGTSGIGTVGIGKGADPGVLGRNSDGDGVRGEGSIGVRGEGSIGVLGESNSSSAVGILGRNDGGTGVQGDGKNGVFGRGSSGYGGFFEGGKAQLRLRPAGSAGKPSGAHSAGEIYMDSAGTLFVCVKGGNPAEWKKLSATAV